MYQGIIDEPKPNCYYFYYTLVWLVNEEALLKHIDDGVHGGA